jgi:hypothetical protein
MTIGIGTTATVSQQGREESTFVINGVFCFVVLLFFSGSGNQT